MAVWPLWRRLQPMSEEEYRREKDRLLKRVPVPLFWLFGKTGSGKTSIVRYLTGAPDAEIGNGFQPKTLYSRQYDFPSSEQPLVRFLDTRGLGESAYDPREDLRVFDRLAQVLVVIVRLTDTAVEPIIEPLRRIRQSHPSRPVVLALTCLHQAYPGQQHPRWEALAGQDDSGGLPGATGEHLDRQRALFAGLVDRIIPLDLTEEEEGFQDPCLGGEQLQQVLWELLPSAYRQTFLQLEEEIRPLRDLNQRRAMPLVVSYSLLAASAGAVPVPWVDVPLVAAIQSHMVRQLQRVYDQQPDPRFVGSYLGAQSGQMLTRLALRSWLKLVPVLGAAASAALAYTSTYALGKVCCWYFGEVRQGNAPSEADVRRVWHQQLSLAGQRWQRRRR